jgi:hypothetical protein
VMSFSPTSASHAPTPGAWSVSNTGSSLTRGRGVEHLAVFGRGPLYPEVVSTFVRRLCAAGRKKPEIGFRGCIAHKIRSDNVLASQQSGKAAGKPGNR